jgi:hypothetical protein
MAKPITQMQRIQRALLDILEDSKTPTAQRLKAADKLLRAKAFKPTPRTRKARQGRVGAESGSILGTR